MQIVQSLRLVSSARLLFTYRVGTWLSPWRGWLNTKTTVPVVVRRKLVFSPKSGQSLLQFIDKKQKSVQAFMCLTCSINICFFFWWVRLLDVSQFSWNIMLIRYLLWSWMNRYLFWFPNEFVIYFIFRESSLNGTETFCPESAFILHDKN